MKTSEPGLLGARARMFIRGFGWVIAILFLLVYLNQRDLSAYWGLALVGIGLPYLYYATMQERKYYSPAIFSLFFMMGFLGSLTAVLPTRDSLPITGDGSYGSFSFTDTEFFHFIAATLSGMLALFVGTILMERVTKQRPPARSSPDPDAMLYLLVGWFVGSVAVLLLMWYLGIGRLGLLSATKLPRGMATALYYCRNMVIPCVGMYLLEVIIASRNRQLLHVFMIGFILLAVGGSLTSLSRGYIMTTVAVALGYLILRPFEVRGGQRIALAYMLASVILVPILTYAVNEYRDIAYTSGTTKNIDPITIRDSTQRFRALDAGTEVLNLAMRRIGGSRELMAVMSSGAADLERFWGFFLGDQASMDTLHSSIYGFVPNVGDDTAYGTELGFFGTFMTTGSLSITFIACLLCMAYVLCVEKLFVDRGHYGVALYFAVAISSGFWGGVYWSMLYKHTLAVAGCFVIVRHLDKMVYGVMRKSRPKKPAESAATSPGNPGRRGRRGLVGNG